MSDDDYITTQVLPQSMVTAAISGDGMQDDRNAERIAAHDRRLAALDHQMDLIEKDLRDVERRAGQYAFMVMALLAVLVFLWTS